MSRIIAATKDKESFLYALKSKVKIIFDLSPSISDLNKKAEECHKCGKLLFMHMDLAEGIARDRAGLEYVRSCGIDGVISTRPQLIKMASELGLKTVQRVFVLDSQSIDAAASMLKTKPDMVEFMPGVISAKVIDRLKSELNIPIIAGGLIETEDEVRLVIEAGVSAVSTSRTNLWNL